MDAARWERIEELFHAVVDLPPSEQRAALEARCDDPALRAEVLDLLEDDLKEVALLGQSLSAVAQAVTETETDALPQQIGPYRVLSVLGEGGMAVVYLGERTDLENRVAIKLLRDASLSLERRRRFFAEQKLLAGLIHPSIARLYDAGTLPDGTPWFAMEYVDGQPIATSARRPSRTGCCFCGRRAKRSSSRTAAPSSTAISNRPTCWSRATEPSACWTSVLPSRSKERGAASSQRPVCA
jgi:serine/threonine protein kinase